MNRLRWLFPLLLIGCRPSANAPSCCTESAGTEPVSERSLHLLDATWHSADGKDLRLAEVAGEVRFLTFVYTTCEYACPATIAELKRFEAAIAPRDLPRVRFVLVTMDPKRDRPEVLAEYAKSHGLSPERWTLLQGDDETTRDLAAVVGFRIKKVGNGFTHSNAVYALDRRGVIVASAEGQPMPREGLLAALHH